MLPNDPRHGTKAGPMAHRRAGQTPCSACKEAHRRSQIIRQLHPPKTLAIGSQRRIQALQAIGYSRDRIAAELGYTDAGALNYLMQAKTMLKSTAVRVAEVYERLCMTVPVGPGATRARTWAKRHGHMPPLAWEGRDIDDPDAIPDLGEIKHDSRGRPVVRDALIEDAEWLADDDLHLDVVVERLGVTRANFHAACRRAGRLDLYHRLARRLPYGAGADSMAQHARRTA